MDCPLEEDQDDLGEEEEYDALNDETFGPDATIGDWEKDHEKLAEITESSRLHNQNATNKKVHCDFVALKKKQNYFCIPLPLLCYYKKNICIF